MQTVAIFGVGLIGGSFGLALRRAKFAGAILGVSSARTLERARELGAIDQGSTLREASAEADLIFLSQPVPAILEAIPRIAKEARADALITDAGSTKAAIAQAGKKAFPAGNFLGGHPLAGKEQRGIDSAGAGLFDGRTWVLTPDSSGAIELPLAQAYISVLCGIGARPVAISPEEHDRILAFTSHLPQLASTAFAAALGEALDSAYAGGHPMFGPALLDSTRLALSPFSVWSGILDTNREEIQRALECYIIKLQQFKDVLREKPVEDLESGFQAAARFSGILRRTK